MFAPQDLRRDPQETAVSQWHGPCNLRRVETRLRALSLALGCALLACAGPVAPVAAQSASTGDDDYMLTTTPGQRRYDAPALRNTGMIVTSVGIASTLIGGAAMIGGAVADAHCDHTDSGFCTFGGVMIGGYMLLGSAAVLSIGIPLWVVGSRSPEEAGGADARHGRHARFTLSLRATAGSARWDF
jgi:hypothetical protein